MPCLLSLPGALLALALSSLPHVMLPALHDAAGCIACSVRYSISKTCWLHGAVAQSFTLISTPPLSLCCNIYECQNWSMHLLHVMSRQTTISIMPMSAAMLDWIFLLNIPTPVPYLAPLANLLDWHKLAQCFLWCFRFDTGTLRSFQEYKLQQAARKAAQGRWVPRGWMFAVSTLCSFTIAQYEAYYVLGYVENMLHVYNKVCIG